MLLGRYLQESAEDVGSVVHDQSHSSPPRHTWTSARFAAWLPELLVPRAQHRGDRILPFFFVIQARYEEELFLQ